MRIYLCEDGFESIMTAVYDAWGSGLGHKNVKLLLDGAYNLELFAEYVKVEKSIEKTELVVKAIKNKLSVEVFEYVYKAALSWSAKKADMIYRFLVTAFKRGPGVIRQLGEKSVMDLFELVRNVDHEAHVWLGFLRFRQLGNGVLFSEISPKNQVITLVAPHFADRLPGESWVIYDEVHKLAALHSRNGQWVLTEELPKALVVSSSDKQEEFEQLWKVFFRTIGIQERTNKKVQRGMLPLWYRKHMLEFDEKC